MVYLVHILLLRCSKTLKSILSTWVLFTFLSIMGICHRNIFLITFIVEKCDMWLIALFATETTNN